MNSFKKRVMKTYLILIVILSAILFSCGKQDVDANTNVSIDGKITTDLQFLREEEKLARDVYLYAFDRYKDQIFLNISQSEQAHYDAVGNLLAKYHIPDPSAGMANGAFKNIALKSLYDSITNIVAQSALSAYKMGALIEDMDINDIADFKYRATTSDITTVYDRLQCGSRNHIRSFSSKLLMQDYNYTPSFITVTEYHSILNSSQEQCGR